MHGLPPLPSPPLPSLVEDKQGGRSGLGGRGRARAGRQSVQSLFKARCQPVNRGQFVKAAAVAARNKKKSGSQEGRKEGRKEGSKGCWDGNGMGRVAPHAALSVTVSPSELDAEAEGVTVSECDDALSLSLLFTF